MYNSDSLPVISSPLNFIIFSDAGKDLDDEHALLLAAALHRRGIIRLRGVVGNLSPAFLRAQLIKATFEQLGLPDIPVAEGTDCLATFPAAPYETSVPYMPPDGSIVHLPARGLRPYQQSEPARWLEQCPDKSVTLLCISPLTDALKLFFDDGELFLNKVASVVIMGGVNDELCRLGFLEAKVGFDGPFNNVVDPEAASFFYRVCQEQNIPLTILARHAVYQCPFPLSVYQQFTRTGHVVAREMYARHKSSMDQLWECCHASPGSPLRKGLSGSRNRDWFVKTFCGGVDPNISEYEAVWPYMVQMPLFDPLTLLAAIPPWRDFFFHPTSVTINGTTHQVIGWQPGGVDIMHPKQLRAFVIDQEMTALAHSAQGAAAFV